MVKAKATAIQQARSSKPKQGKGYAHLVEAIGGLIDSARQRVAQMVNTEMVMLYWEIGRHIVEYEQGSSDRAKYGAHLLEHLSGDLMQRYGRGFSLRNLRNFRLLYQAFPIRQALPAELSWTHLLLILRVEEPLAREGQQVQHPADLLRDPFAFEFLDLPEPFKRSERLRKMPVNVPPIQSALKFYDAGFLVNLQPDTELTEAGFVVLLVAGHFLQSAHSERIGSGGHDVESKVFYLRPHVVRQASKIAQKQGTIDDTPVHRVFLCLA